VTLRVEPDESENPVRVFLMTMDRAGHPLPLGRVAGLWLVRERAIEREPLETVAEATP